MDHQGINFKLTDRKAISTKSLINEIETLQHEQKERKSDLANRYQFDFTFKDQGVFENVISILMNYIENTATITSAEEERVQGLLDEFVAKMFVLEDVSDEKSENGDFKDDGNMDIDVPAGAEQVVSEPTMQVDQQGDPLVPIQTGDEIPTRRKSHTLYCNSHLYCFMRLFQVYFF